MWAARARGEYWKLDRPRLTSKHAGITHVACEERVASVFDNGVQRVMAADDLGARYDEAHRHQRKRTMEPGLQSERHRNE